jgi:hypothetical protein
VCCASAGSIAAPATHASEGRGALTAPARRRVRILWFQYEISFAAYCFEWWEKLIVHAVLLSVLFLASYGAYRQGAALWARLGALPWCARLAPCGVLWCASARGRGTRCGRAWRAGGRSTGHRAQRSAGSA